MRCNVVAAADDNAFEAEVKVSQFKLASGTETRTCVRYLQNKFSENTPMLYLTLKEPMVNLNGDMLALNRERT